MYQVSAVNVVNVGAINGPQQTALSDTFLLQTYTLSQFVNDTVLVRFSASRGFGNANQADIAIDDFGFQEAPTCPDPWTCPRFWTLTPLASFIYHYGI